MSRRLTSIFLIAVVVSAGAAFLRAQTHDAGFTIEVYEETRNWRSLLTNALDALVASEEAVRKEVGGPRAEWLLAWARTRPAELDHSRRVRFCLQRGG